jgi:hypothetical protein
MAVMTFKQIEKQFHGDLLTYCANTKDLDVKALSDFIDSFCSQNGHTKASIAKDLKEGFMWVADDGKIFEDLSNPTELSKDVYLEKRRQKIKG